MSAITGDMISQHQRNVLSFFVIYQPANVWAQLQLRSSADGVNARGVLKLHVTITDQSTCTYDYEVHCEAPRLITYNQRLRKT